jgi:hypothetical protein
MAFPSTALGTVVQMKINGTWTSVVRYDAVTRIKQKAGIDITRGQGGLQDKTPSSVCKWEWQDPNGVYNNENPRSPYYNLIPRNTPVRVYVPRAAASLFMLQDDTTACATTTDKAAIRVTGDIEIRFDFEPRRFSRWSSGVDSGFILGGKHDITTNQRGWYVRVGDPYTNSSTVSKLALAWSTDGVATNFAEANAAIPAGIERLSVKITMDVDNGAGGRDIKFYYSTTGINGSYTQIGTTVTQAGTTSIFASTATLQLGKVVNFELNGFSNLLQKFAGRIHGFQLYNGIAGSKVAEADYTAQATGTTSFADGLGNTWTLLGNAEITNAQYRFYGLFSAPVLKPNKSRSGTGVDVAVAAESGGLIRLITSNETPVISPISYAFRSYTANGWWSGEDEANSDTTYASSGLDGARPASISDITFNGFDSGIPGSAGVMTCGSTNPQFSGYATTVATTGESHFYAFFKFPSIPASDQLLFTWNSTGTVAKYTLTVTINSYRLDCYGNDGTLLATSNAGYSGTEPTNWIAYHSRSILNAGNVNVSHEWYRLDTRSYATVAVLNAGAGSMGRFTKVTLAGAGLANVKFCQVMVSNQVGLEFASGSAAANVATYANAFSGELADARFLRICGLLSITGVVFGRDTYAEAMGPQPIDTGINILYECAAFGMLSEAIDQLALEFRATRALRNQQAQLALTYGILTQGLEGTPDDTDVANDVTMSRAAGGSSRAVQLYGPMSTQAPPNGIYTVPDGPTTNGYTVDRLPYLTQDYLTRHSWPGSRYPSIVIDMHHPDYAGNSSRFLDAEIMDLGDMISISSLPTFMAPDTLQLLVKGMHETLYAQLWTIDCACIPYGPYVVSELDTSVGSPYSGFVAQPHTLLGVAQLQLNAGINSSATSIDAKTLSGPVLKTGAVSYTIKIGGEFMAVTNVAGATSPQTLTVTRGTVGAYTAAHSANDAIVFNPVIKASL